MDIAEPEAKLRESMACKRWPRKAITLRQEGRVIEDTALRAAARLSTN